LQNPAAAKNPTVQVVQYVQTVQVVESFEGSENGIDPDVLARKIVEDSKPPSNNFAPSLVGPRPTSVNPGKPTVRLLNLV
jgi:hypothetical protein